jgi:hypothetical protein
VVPVGNPRTQKLLLHHDTEMGDEIALIPRDSRVPFFSAKKATRDVEIEFRRLIRV